MDFECHFVLFNLCLLASESFYYVDKLLKILWDFNRRHIYITSLINCNQDVCYKKVRKINIKEIFMC